MAHISIPPFFVGQKVVALVNMGHPYGGDIVKDRVYTVGFVGRCSECGEWNIGFKPCTFEAPWTCCSIRNQYTGFWVACADKFAPIESTFEAISYEMVMDNESPFIGVN